MSDESKRRVELKTRLEKLQSHRSQILAALAGVRGDRTALVENQRRRLSLIAAQIRRIATALGRGTHKDG